jgi:hypothetical protein
MFTNHHLYRHHVLRINFTTYDLRRSQDSCNPRTAHCDVMVHARDDTTSPHYHPYWYARIIGIFHVHVVHQQPNGTLTPPQKIHFLWVRWFGKDLTYRSGPHARHLDRIGFVTDSDDTEPFGFLDPANVIRAVHLIPAFAHGRTDGLLGPSIARRDSTSSLDWKFFYVNRCVYVLLSSLLSVGDQSWQMGRS